MTDYIKDVKRYALEHYDYMSWSYIIETFSDQDIQKLIGDATSLTQAISNIRKWVIEHFSCAEDIRNS